MSEYVLEKGRPADASGRLGKEIRVYDFLDRLGIDYERVDHPALMTMEACESVDKMLDTRICKNLFLRNAQRTQFYLLLMPGTENPCTDEAGRQEIQNRRAQQADWFGASLLRRTGVHAGYAGYHARQRQRAGVDE